MLGHLGILSICITYGTYLSILQLINAFSIPILPLDLNYQLIYHQKAKIEIKAAHVFVVYS